MKKLILSVFIALLSITINSNAKDIDDSEKNYLKNASINENMKAENNNGKHTIIQGFEGNSFLEESPSGAINHFTPYPSSPISYDPLTNTTYVVASERVFRQGQLSESINHIYRFDSNGDLLESKEFPLDTSFISLRPSIAVRNQSENVGSLEESEYVVFIPKAAKNDTVNSMGQKTFPTVYGGYFFFNSEEFGEFDDEVTGPDAPSINDDVLWNQVNLRNDFNAGNNIIYGGNVLYNENTLPHYGFWSFDYSDVISKVPNEWQANKFHTADLQPGFRRHGEMRMDNDDEGNLYAAVFNIFEYNRNARLFGVSKSTDGGNNWDAFTTSEPSLLDQFLNNFDGYEDVNFATPFEIFDFTVTGVDEWSFYTTLYINSDDLPLRSFIVEFSYDNNAWSLNQVAELNSFGESGENLGPNLISGSVPDQDFQFYNEVYFRRNFNGNQIQVSKTVDGDKLLLMWIDVNLERERIISPPAEVYVRTTDPNTNDVIYEKQQLESLYSTDIYSVTKDLNTGEWSEKVNVSNDEVYDKFFFLPEFLSDVKEVPIITTKPKDRSFFIPRISDRPQIITEMAFDITNDITFSVIDATQSPNSVEENELDFNVSLGNVSPNPAKDEITIPITLEQPANIKVEIFNTLGQKVLHVFDGFMQNDVMTVNAYISNLQNGTYYYSLTVQGQKLTKVLNIVR